jgi:hypothetical protein
MTKTRKRISVIMMLTAVILLTVGTGCKGNDPASREATYSLKAKDVLGVSGTVTFIETGSSSTTIEVKLTGSAVVGSHPIELRRESAVENGTLVQLLNPVDVNGKSTTVLTTMSFSQLKAYDGCIKVLKSSSETNMILAQGDIGGNEITATNKSYALQGKLVGISGNALFEKRVNGNTLVTLTLIGGIATDSYPATINVGSSTTVGGGPVTLTLNNVEGATGKSYTNVRKLNDGTLILYTDWLVYTGYINIYQTAPVITNIICSGDIGKNVTK